MTAPVPVRARCTISAVLRRRSDPGWRRFAAAGEHQASRALEHHAIRRLSEWLEIAFDFVDQTLINEIFTSHPEYKGFGLPDTPNATDNVVGNASLATYLLETKRMVDGAMLAWKQIVLG